MTPAANDQEAAPIQSAERSIAKRIRRLVLLCTTLGLVLACSAFVTYDLVTFRQSLATNAVMLADITAKNSVGALAFFDDQAADAALGALAASPSVRYAAILDTEGNVFAEYSRDKETAPPAALNVPPEGVEFRDGALFASRLIKLGGASLGTVVINMSLEERMVRLQRFGSIGALILFFSAAAAVLMSSRLRQTIVAPISELTRLAERVSDDEDYSLRAKSSDITEISVLAGGFNKMLAAIETRDRQLQRGSERLELALSANGQGMWDINLQTGEVFLDAHICRFLDVESIRHQRDLQALGDLVHDDDLSVITSTFKAHLDGDTEAVEVEHRVRRGDEWHWMSIHGKLVERSNEGAAVRLVGTYRDINARKKQEHEREQLETELHHAHKLESIGQLAAGIAHEINTPIQFVGDNVRFLGTSFDDLSNVVDELSSVARNGSSDAADVVEKVLTTSDVGFLKQEVPAAISQAIDGIERVSKIVKAMKDFSHPGEDLSPANINRAIESTIAVSSNEWKYVAELETNLDESLPEVPCVLGEFNQVILNIVVNAAHAIASVVGESSAEKGKITITTAVVDEWAEIRIADTGGGMPDEILSKVFDPFFTTKEVGKGTGQGLSIAHSVITERHKGTLSVESQLGIGTRFLIRLPLVATSVEQTAAA